MATATAEPEAEPEVDPQASTHTAEWAAARALAGPIVATKAAERKRTFDMMKAGKPMYGVEDLP